VTTTPAPTPPPDIAFPLKTRSGDTAGNHDRIGESASVEAPAADAATRRTPLPFLFERLLCGHGPFGLEVEAKSRDRMVGTWPIEIGLRDADGVAAAHVSANLYLCASRNGDERATGAFLVVRQWWVRDADKAQIERLYEMLSAAALERLDALMGNLPNENGEYRPCVLFLVTDRHLDRRLVSLDRLELRILEDLETEHAIAGIDLRVAHGRGRGTQPHAVFASTLPAPLQPGDVGFDARRRGGTGSMIGEVFVRETLSPANVRWNRRASDRPPGIDQPPRKVR
jgi:hypothetical protein